MTNRKFKRVKLISRQILIQWNNKNHKNRRRNNQRKSKVNISSCQLLKDYVKGNKFTTAMVEEAIDFYWPGMDSVLSKINTIASRFESGLER